MPPGTSPLGDLMLNLDCSDPTRSQLLSPPIRVPHIPQKANNLGFLSLGHQVLR